MVVNVVAVVVIDVNVVDYITLNLDPRLIVKEVEFGWVDGVVVVCKVIIRSDPTLLSCV